MFVLKSGAQRMHGLIRLLCAITLMAMACPSAQAKVNFVIVGGSGLIFSPQTIDIVAGDSITFLNFGGVHNVEADDGSFRCALGCDNDGHGGRGASSGQLWSVSIDFPNPETIGYFCEAHGAPGTGMFGTIIVVAAAPVSPAPVDGRWPLSLLALVVATSAIIALRSGDSRPDAANP